jgi:hypothetical protein
MERAIAMSRFGPSDSGIYAEFDAKRGLPIGPKRDCIFPEIESWQPSSDGNLAAKLEEVENELREEIEGKHPQSCESGQVEAELAFAWLSEVHRWLGAGDINRAVLKAFWLGVCLERMRVTRLEELALKAKKLRGNQRAGGKATKKLTEEQGRMAASKVQTYVNEREMTRTKACEKVAREFTKMLGRPIGYKAILGAINRSE